METASRATKGWSLTLMIRKSSRAMPRAATVSRPAVPWIRAIRPPVWGGVSGRRRGERDRTSGMAGMT